MTRHDSIRSRVHLLAALLRPRGCVSYSRGDIYESGGAGFFGLANLGERSRLGQRRRGGGTSSASRHLLFTVIYEGYPQTSFIHVWPGSLYRSPRPQFFLAFTSSPSLCVNESESVVFQFSRPHPHPHPLGFPCLNQGSRRLLLQAWLLQRFPHSMQLRRAHAVRRRTVHSAATTSSAGPPDPTPGLSSQAVLSWHSSRSRRGA